MKNIISFFSFILSVGLLFGQQCPDFSQIPYPSQHCCDDGKGIRTNPANLSNNECPSALVRVLTNQLIANSNV